MPVITKVEPQKKTDKRVNIHLDGQFAFAISLETAVKSHLKEGITISADAIKDLIFTDYYEKLLDNLLGFVGRRPRSERELRDHAKEYFYRKYGKDFDPKVFENVLTFTLEKLKKFNQVNDLEFAKWWVEQRLRSNKSTRIIKQELFQKGVNKDLIEDLLKEGGGDESAKAKALAERKISSYKNLEPEKRKEKLSRYLASKGFDWEVIKEAVKGLIPDREI